MMMMMMMMMTIVLHIRHPMQSLGAAMAWAMDMEAFQVSLSSPHTPSLARTGSLPHAAHRVLARLPPRLPSCLHRRRQLEE
eukprot:401071-Hanusia_phi.AAC.1